MAGITGIIIPTPNISINAVTKMLIKKLFFSFKIFVFRD
jgi:hypothetical protein